MTYEIDIVQRAGRLYVSGSFKISNMAEFQTFNQQFKAQCQKIGLSISPSQEPPRPVLPVPTPAKGASITRRSRDANDLTPRERVVAAMKMEGIKPAEIAKRMGISVRTVYEHIKYINKKRRGAAND